MFLKKQEPQQLEQAFGLASCLVPNYGMPKFKYGVHYQPQFPMNVHPKRHKEMAQGLK